MGQSCFSSPCGGERRREENQFDDPYTGGFPPSLSSPTTPHQSTAIQQGADPSLSSYTSVKSLATELDRPPDDDQQKPPSTTAPNSALEMKASDKNHEEIACQPPASQKDTTPKQVTFPVGLLSPSSPTTPGLSTATKQEPAPSLSSSTSVKSLATDVETEASSINPEMAEMLALAKHDMPLLRMLDMKSILAGMNQVDIQRETHPFQCKLAASYGDRTSDAVRRMDEALKVCIAATVKAVIKSNVESWEGLVACMMNNPVLEHKRGCDVQRLDNYTEKGVSWFKFDGSPNPAIVQEVYFWFKQLISDDDILKDLRIDMDGMEKIVAQTGARFDSIETLLCNTEYTERTVLDTGILRYPDIDRPYFKLYRIELKAWSHCNRVLVRQEDRNGITGDFKCMQFKPRKDVIANIRPEIRAKAVAEAEKLLI